MVNLLTTSLFNGRKFVFFIILREISFPLVLVQVLNVFRNSRVGMWTLITLQYFSRIFDVFALVILKTL